VISLRQSSQTVEGSQNVVEFVNIAKYRKSKGQEELAQPIFSPHYPGIT